MLIHCMLVSSYKDMMDTKLVSEVIQGRVQLGGAPQV